MFNEETNIYKARCECFISRLQNDRFMEEIPLTAELAWSKLPVPFSEREKLSFRSIKEGDKWGEVWESAWVKISGTIPEHWPLQECALNVNFSGEALIFTPDGIPFYALSGGSYFNPNFRKTLFRIPKEWIANRRFSVWIEAAANSLGGAGTKPDPGRNDKDLEGRYPASVESLRLSRHNDEIWHLQWEFFTLFDLCNSLEEKDYRRKQLLAVLNEAVSAYQDDPANAAAARAVLKTELNRPAVSSALNVTAVGHAHIDVGWLWPVRETIRKSARTFANQLYLIDKYPGYVFGASQPQLYQFVKDYYPGLYDKIRRRVADGSWELQGGMWVEADCNLINGESMIRQFLIGKNFFMDEFGIDVKTLWLPDVFGYSAAMPQIIRRAGCDYFLTQKISWNQVNHFPHNTFYWSGIDDTKVLTHFPPENTYIADCNPSQRIAGQNQYHEAVEAPQFMSLFGIGDGGGGPSEEYIERAKLIENLEGCPKQAFGSSEKFFKELQKYQNNLPSWKGELYLEMHRGTLTTQARTKKANRQLEQLLTTLEFIASCGKLADYPQQQLDKLWKMLLINQFHDIIPGSSIREVYDVTEREHRQGIAAAKSLIEQAMINITEADDNSIAVANTLPYEWYDLVTLPDSWKNTEVLDSNGKALTRQIVDGKIMVLARLNPGEITSWHKGCVIEEVSAEVRAEAILENDLVRYQFNANGEIISAFDKETGVESFPDGKRGNIFSLYVDRPNMYDAWDVEPFYPSEYCGGAKLISRSVVESGACVSFFDQEFSVGKSSTLRQRVSLRNNSRRLDFITHADWHETHRMLRVAFDFHSFTSEAAFEIQYGYVKRPTHMNTSWDAAKFEVVGHRYADRSSASGGAALLNDCKYGYCHLRDGLDLNLLRSPLWPDFTADRGEHDFTYSFMPHAGELASSTVMAEAAGLNRPVAIVAGRAIKHPSVPVSASGDIRIEVIKKAEKEDCLVVRVAEARGQNGYGKLHFCHPLNKVVETNLMEWTNENTLEIVDRCVKIELKPFEIRTFKVYFSALK